MTSTSTPRPGGADTGAITDTAAGSPDPSGAASAPWPADLWRGAAALRGAAEAAAEHLRAAAQGPVWRAMPEAVRAALSGAALPETGLAPDALLAEAADRVLAYPMGNGHPAFFGWVNAAPHPAGVAGALLAAAMNPSSAGGDHADVPLERAVMRWLAQLVGYPHEPGAGLLTSGASMATLVAFGAARHRALAGAGWDVREQGLAGAPSLTVYATAQAHSCVRKAVELLGLGARALRTVPERDGRMDTGALRAVVAEDRAAGGVPFLAVASAGTVNTGAIDPLDEAADVCAAAGLWLHVDGAYGAFGILDPRLAGLYRGMERADSLAVDPHKWLQVPAGVGALLVRDREALRAAYSLVPPYLRDEGGDGLGWYSEYGIEQTRAPRSLPVWAALAARGRAGVAADVAACTASARRLAALVADAPDLEPAAPAGVSMVAYRYAPPGAPAGAVDRVNAALPAAIQARGRAFVTGSVYGGRPILRACVINPRTGEQHLRALVEETRAAGAALMADGD
jgi:glutamate/tyrosine decarboxylase-like PLP-dependent enzyme